MVKASPLELTRIQLRQSIYNMLANKSTVINNPRHELVGRMVLVMLNSAFNHLAAMAFAGGGGGGGLTEGCGLLQKIGGVVGLMISIIASSTDCELSSAYRAVLYDNSFAPAKVRLRDRWLVASLIKAWP